ncbi:MAG: Thioredoxin reductase [Dehalococcoidia bacterium]|nr:Thioredoxin reductase [Dehalococcoidia bacterium]
MSSISEHEVIIVGGGPAGLTAGLYASRAGLKAVALEKGLIGGQIINAPLVENYPGFPHGIAGSDLGDLMCRQAEKHGLRFITGDVVGVEVADGYKVVRTSDGELRCKVVIAATGSERQKLGVPGEQLLLGRGVSYCATCDGPLFRGETVAVVGGGDVAITEALSLVAFVNKIVVIHRRDELRASAILRERAQSEPKISFLWSTVVSDVLGDDKVRELSLRDVKTVRSFNLEVSGVFVCIGHRPNTDYLAHTLPLDPAGYVITDVQMRTDVPGLFAAGDIRQNSARQVVAAAGDGATAALSAEKFLKGI